MKKNTIKIIYYKMVLLATLAVLVGCAAGETIAPIGSGGSATIVGEVTYKPFASGHAGKFS